MLIQEDKKESESSAGTVYVKYRCFGCGYVGHELSCPDCGRKGLKSLCPDCEKVVNQRTGHCDYCGWGKK